MSLCWKQTSKVLLESSWILTSLCWNCTSKIVLVTCWTWRSRVPVKYFLLVSCWMLSHISCIRANRTFKIVIRQLIHMPQNYKWKLDSQFWYNTVNNNHSQVQNGQNSWHMGNEEHIETVGVAVPAVFDFLSELTSSVPFNSRWYLCARQSSYVLHPVSQIFPQRCIWIRISQLNHNFTQRWVKK